MRASQRPYDSVMTVLALLLALQVVLMPQLVLWSHTADDSYIAFRYVENVTAGRGLTFNPGEHVEGFSSPLWVGLLALMTVFTPMSVPDAARTLGLSSSLLTVLALWWVVKPRESPRERLSLFAVAALVMLCVPGYHIFATAGLEGPLLGLLLLFGVGASLREGRMWSRVAAATFGLVGVIRPEGLLYGILWLIATRKGRERRPADRALLLQRIVLVTLPAAVYEVFRVAYFGSWLPNTAVAKLPGAFGDSTLAYLSPWLFSVGGPVLLGLWLFLRVDADEGHSAIQRAAIGPVAAGIIFVLYARGDWMPFGRFVVPVWPVVALLLSSWLHSARSALEKRGMLSVAPALVPSVVAMIVLASLYVWAEDVSVYLHNEEYTTVMIGEDQVAVGRWLQDNAPPGTTVATIRLGGVSWAAPDLVFWDLLGLTDKEQAAHVSHGSPGGLAEDPVLNRAPDIVAATRYPDMDSYRYHPRLLKWLEERYVMQESFPQGAWGTMDIWVRDDLL